MDGDILYEGNPAWVNSLPLLILTGGLLLCSFAGIGFFYLAIIFGLVTAFKRYGCHAMVTSTRIVTRFGVLNTKTYEIDIKDIRSINVSQTFFQKMLGLGDLEFATASGAVKEAAIFGISDPNGLKERIRALKS